MPVNDKSRRRTRHFRYDPLVARNQRYPVVRRGIGFTSNIEIGKNDAPRQSDERAGLPTPMFSVRCSV